MVFCQSNFANMRLLYHDSNATVNYCYDVHMSKKLGIYAGILSLYSYAFLLSIHTLFPLPGLPKPGVISLGALAMICTLFWGLCLLPFQQRLPQTGTLFWLLCGNVILLILALLLHPLIWLR